MTIKRYTQIRTHLEEPERVRAVPQRLRLRWQNLPIEYELPADWDYELLEEAILQVVTEKDINAVDAGINAAFDLAWPMVRACQETDLPRRHWEYLRSMQHVGQKHPLDWIEFTSYIMANLRFSSTSADSMQRAMDQAQTIALAFHESRRQPLLTSEQGAHLEACENIANAMSDAWDSVGYARHGRWIDGSFRMRLMVQNLAAAALELYDQAFYESNPPWSTFDSNIAREFAEHWYNEWLTRLAYIA